MGPYFFIDRGAQNIQFEKSCTLVKTKKKLNKRCKGNKRFDLQ
jgi:hypothetical protein